MSMSLDIGDDTDDLDRDDIDDDDLDDDDEDGGRSTRGNDRRTAKRTDNEPDEDDEDDDEDKSPEELKAELKRLRKAVSTAGKQTARQRDRVKELRKSIRDAGGKADDEDDDEEDEGKPKRRTEGLDARAAQKLVSKAVRERERALQEEHRRDLIDTRAEAALERAGVSAKNLRLLKRELDYDEIDFDPKKRSIDGLDEEIDRLKDEFPDLFRRPKTERRRISGGDDRARGERKVKTLTATEIQARQLRGR